MLVLSLGIGLDTILVYLQVHTNIGLNHGLYLCFILGFIILLGLVLDPGLLYVTTLGLCGGSDEIYTKN